MLHSQQTSNNWIYERLLKCNYYEIERLREDVEYSDYINNHRHSFSKLEVNSVEVTTENNNEFVVSIKGIKTEKIVNFEKFSVNLLKNLQACLNGLIPDCLICDLNLFNKLDKSWYSQRKKICVRKMSIESLFFLRPFSNTTHLEMELTREREDLGSVWHYFSNLVHLTLVGSGNSNFTNQSMINMSASLSQLKNFQYLEMKLGDDWDVAGIGVMMKFFKCTNGGTFKFSNLKNGDEQSFSNQLNKLAPSIVSHTKNGELYTITRSDGTHISCILQFA